MSSEFIAAFEVMAKQIFALWIIPEQEKRMKSGAWKNNQHLSAAQILLDDKGAVEIRFNAEVRGTLKVDPIKPLEPGQAVLITDIDRFIDFELLEQDRDRGHVTIMNQGKPAIFFDFRRNRFSGIQTVNLAEQFLSAAKFSHENNLIARLIDNLFSVYELIAKAKINTSFMGANESKRHGKIASDINQLGRFGFCPSDFIRIFNDLSNKRSGARYDPRGLTRLNSGLEAIAVAVREIDAYKRFHEKNFDP